MTYLIALLIAPCPQAALAPPTARMTDQQVKKLIEQVDNDRDRFEDQLDGNLKRKVLRGPGGEVDVERFLDDLQQNIDKLESRFTDSYSAGSEVGTVLKQGSSIQRYMV